MPPNNDERAWQDDSISLRELIYRNSADIAVLKTRLDTYIANQEARHNDSMSKALAIFSALVSLAIFAMQLYFARGGP